MPSNGFLGRAGHLLGRVAVTFGLRPPPSVALPTVEGGGTVALADGPSGTVTMAESGSTVALGATASTVALLGAGTTTIAKDD